MEMTEIKIKTKKPKLWVYVIFIAIQPIASTLATVYLATHNVGILEIVLCIALWTIAFFGVHDSLATIYHEGKKAGLEYCIELNKKITEELKDRFSEAVADDNQDSKAEDA